MNKGPISREIAMRVPEPASKVYDACLEYIEQFEKIRRMYIKKCEEAKKIDGNSSHNSQFSLSGACLKSALMQLTCLIGDRMIWLREPHNWPNPSSNNPASNRNSYVHHFIRLRNLYAHRFLYKRQEEQKEDFHLLLNDNTQNKLNEMKESLLKQKESLKEDFEFTAKSGKPFTPPYDFSRFLIAGWQSSSILSEISKNRDELSEDLSDNVVKLAVDCLIKNTIQTYQDHNRQLEKPPPGFEYEKKIEAINNNKGELSQNPAFVFLIDGKGAELRKVLAHPNMIDSENKVDPLRDKFIDNIKKFQSMLEFFWNKFKFSEEDEPDPSKKSELDSSKKNKSHSIFNYELKLNFNDSFYFMPLSMPALSTKSEVGKEPGKQSVSSSSITESNVNPAPGLVFNYDSDLESDSSTNDSDFDIGLGDETESGVDSEPELTDNVSQSSAQAGGSVSHNIELEKFPAAITSFYDTKIKSTKPLTSQGSKRKNHPSSKTSDSKMRKL